MSMSGKWHILMTLFLTCSKIQAPLMLQTPELNIVLLVESHESREGERMTSLYLLVTLPFIQPRIWLVSGLQAHSAVSCWASHQSILLNVDCWKAPLIVLFHPFTPQSVLLLVIAPPRHRTVYLAVLNFMSFPQPTYRACQGLSGWHPFLSACQAHHTVWCHLTPSSNVLCVTRANRNYSTYM